MNAVSKLAVFGFVLSGASAGASVMAAFEGSLLSIIGAAISAYIFFGAVKEQESFGK